MTDQQTELTLQHYFDELKSLIGWYDFTITQSFVMEDVGHGPYAAQTVVEIIARVKPRPVSLTPAQPVEEPSQAAKPNMAAGQPDAEGCVRGAVSGIPGVHPGGGGAIPTLTLFLKALILHNGKTFLKG